MSTLPTVVSSTLTARGSADPGPSGLWDIAALTRPDWRSPQRVTSRFVTDVQVSRSQVEQRRSQADRATIDVSIPSVAWDIPGINRLITQADRATGARTLVPIWADTVAPHTIETPSGLSPSVFYVDGTSVVEANLFSGDEVGMAIFDRRRFFVGGRVLLWDRTDVTKFAVVTLTSVTLTGTARGLVWASAPSWFPSGTVATGQYAITPLIEARMITGTRFSLATSDFATGVIEAFGDTGDHVLGLRSQPGNADDAEDRGLTIFGSCPVFPVDLIDWSESPSVIIDRTTTFAESGLASIGSAYGDRARTSFEIALLCLDRSKYARLRAIWEYAAGRAHPFWFPSLASTFEAVSVPGTTSLSVRARGPVGDWDRRPAVVVVYADGTTAIRRVESVSRLGSEDTGTDTLTLSASIPAATASTIRRIAVAHLCRFDEDALTEDWLTFEIMRSNVKIREDAHDTCATPVTTPPDIVPPDIADPAPDPWTPSGLSPSVVYELVDCDGVRPTMFSTDAGMADYVGEVVAFVDICGCWTVSVSEDGEESTVTAGEVLASFAVCVDCKAFKVCALTAPSITGIPDICVPEAKPCGDNGGWIGAGVNDPVSGNLDELTYQWSLVRPRYVAMEEAYAIAGCSDPVPCTFAVTDEIDRLRFDDVRTIGCESGVPTAQRESVYTDFYSGDPVILLDQVYKITAYPEVPRSEPTTPSDASFCSELEGLDPSEYPDLLGDTAVYLVEVLSACQIYRLVRCSDSAVRFSGVSQGGTTSNNVLTYTNGDSWTQTPYYVVRADDAIGTTYGGLPTTILADETYFAGLSLASTGTACP